MKYTDFAKAVLKEHSYRLTKPRELVLKVLANAKKALNAYELAAKIEQLNEKVDVSTVYRILEVYKELDLVHFNSQKQRYSACQDYDCGQDEHCHHEFVCKKCDEVIEIHIDDENFIQSIQSINKNLNIKSHYLELQGFCGECKI